MHVEQKQDLAGGLAAAVFDSQARVYRYLLTRIWDPSRPAAVFLMLNPSTADAMSVGQSRIASWEFPRSMMPKRQACTDRASTRGKSECGWASLPTQCERPYAGRAYQFATGEPFQSTTGRSQTCIKKVKRSTASPANSGSVSLSPEEALSDRGSCEGSQPTTAGSLWTPSGSLLFTRKREARTGWRKRWGCRSRQSFMFSTNVAFALGSISISSARLRSRRPYRSTVVAELCGRSSSSLVFRSEPFARHFGGSASLRRTGGRLTVRGASAWARAAHTLGYAWTTRTRWQSCGKQAASSPSIGWSWHDTLVAHCYPVKPSTTSTMTATTTGSKTCNSGSVSTEGATSSSVVTAGPIVFSQHPSRSKPYGTAA